MQGLVGNKSEHQTRHVSPVPTNRWQLLHTFLTEYGKVSLFALKCQHLELDHSKTLLNTS